MDGHRGEIDVVNRNSRQGRFVLLLPLLIAFASAPLFAFGALAQTYTDDILLQGNGFEIHLPADAIVETRGLTIDFQTYRIESNGTWMFIYEGNHPQKPDFALMPTLPIDRKLTRKGADGEIIIYRIFTLFDWPGSIEVILPVDARASDLESRVKNMVIRKKGS